MRSYKGKRFGHDVATKQLQNGSKAYTKDE